MAHDLIIIGAGAAGLFAAANVPDGWKTLVLEKMDSPGKKLLLTGSGQCNLTNDEPIKGFLARYGDNGKHLRPVLFPFSNLALIEYFEKNGLPLKVREDGKVFPDSMKSIDVLDLLLSQINSNGVTISYLISITAISEQDGSEGCRFIIETTEGQYFAKNVLVATGGESYPQTGSDGSVFECLEQLGIRLIPRRPALVPIYVTDYPYSSLSGLTFPNCAISITCSNSNKPVRTEGSLLLTHKGLSGPPILELSRYVTSGDELTINYLPGRVSEDLRLELINTAAGDPRQIITILESLTTLPRSFLEFVCSRSNIDKSEKASRLTGQEMGAISECLTADIYNISGTGDFSLAMTTTGGVSLDEIDLRTMEAKRCPGLYFAGEVLDVDGDTGGYNLQFAFSSAKRSIEAMKVQRQ